LSSEPIKPTGASRQSPRPRGDPYCGSASHTGRASIHPRVEELTDASLRDLYELL
jgi:hypothetical protein